jgi:two-component system response regulator RegA
MTASTNDRNDRPSLLMVDDDRTLCEVMGRALDARGFAVTTLHAATDALHAIERDPPEYALVDLKLPDQSGLKLVARLREADAHTRIVVLTGHASIPTAVEAIKLGALNYLTKPTDADAVVAAFARDEGDASVPIDARAMTVERVEWEHIQHVLHDHGGNISATARALSMHRRTLQRKLQRPPATPS